MCLRTAGILLVSLFLSASAACDGVGGRNVRLVGGSNNRTGRLEVCRNGQWKTMCSQRFNSQDASIVCRELGFSEQGARPINRGFKQANIGTWSVDVTCRGTEETILNCPTNSYREPQRSLCFHTSDVGVSCQPARSGDLRILGGRNTSSGRLEVFYNGTWGTVCQSYWSAKDAQVACRQLGFSASGAVDIRSGSGLYTNRSRFDLTPTWLSSLQCRGDEDSLINCTHIQIGRSTCQNDHTQDVGVVCQKQNLMELLFQSLMTAQRESELNAALQEVQAQKEMQEKAMEEAYLQAVMSLMQKE